MRLSQNNGNDNVYTPRYLAQDIINYYKPTGKILEPCRGDGAFSDYLACDYCEIDENKDFLTYQPNFKYDFIITNPPWSKFRSFLQKSMELADNVIFLSLVNAFFMKARIRDMKEFGFNFKTILFVDTPPKPWPQAGFMLGATHIQKNYNGDVKFDWLVSKEDGIENNNNQLELFES